MKIINKSLRKFPVDLVKVIQKLIKAIPDEHLMGLDSITLWDKPKQKKYKDAQGMYWKKEKFHPARIEIYIYNIYEDYGSRKFLLPVIDKYLLAEVLYHEIGHHYRHLTHGVRKIQNEDFAEHYKKKMLRKEFNYLFYFARPFQPLIKWLLRVWPE